MDLFNVIEVPQEIDNKQIYNIILVLFSPIST